MIRQPPDTDPTGHHTGPRLAGRRVLIGRPAGRSAGLIRLLSAEGAAAQAVPLIDIVPPADSAELDAAVLALSAGECDWVAFTSVNAVSAALQRAVALDVRPLIPAGVRVAAVGPATAGAIRAAGSAVDLMPTRAGSAETLAAIFPTAGAGQSVLLPRSEIAADTLPDALTALGYTVRIAVAYRTVVRPLPDSVAADLAAGGYEAVVMTSPSGVQALTGHRVASGTALVAIGEPTARALSAVGLPAAVVATSPTDEAILTALLGLPELSDSPTTADAEQGES